MNDFNTNISFHGIVPLRRTLVLPDLKSATESTGSVFKTEPVLLQFKIIPTRKNTHLHIFKFYKPLINT